MFIYIYSFKNNTFDNPKGQQQSRAEYLKKIENKFERSSELTELWK